MGRRTRDTVESSLIGTGGWPTNRGIITIQRVFSRGKGSKSHTGIHSTWVLQLAACTYQQVARSLCTIQGLETSQQPATSTRAPAVANLPEEQEQCSPQRDHIALEIRVERRVRHLLPKGISPRSGSVPTYQKHRASQGFTSQCRRCRTPRFNPWIGKQP